MKLLRRNNGEADEDEEEQLSFLNNGRSGSHRVVGAMEVAIGKTGMRISRPCLSILTAVTAVSFTIMVFVSFRSHQWTGGNVTIKNEALFTCPAIKTPTNEDFEIEYAAVSRNMTTDKDEFLRTFRTKGYDEWATTFEKNKKDMFDFKAKFFGPYLKPGSKLYESACGIGLNLLMTLEILQELPYSESGTGITVYGNEYVKESVEQSETVLGEGVLPDGNHKGVICTGDSTNLSHVPPNSFDLVFCGYITPIQDVLGLGGETEDECWARYDEICDSIKSDKSGDWKTKKLWQIAVKKQHDWYGKWIEEMSRIAKPGAPVIAESISYSYCTNRNDWDGIDQEFWHEAAKSNTYNWDIDPDSVDIEVSTKRHRYHVVMLKNKGS